MRRICSGLLLAAVLPCSAMADEFEQGLATLWEVLWHQSGTPTRVVRWESEMRVRIHGVNVAAHRERTLQALRAVTAEAGIKLVDVTEQPDAEQVSNVSVEITPDHQLEDFQPCVTYLDFRAETKIDSAVVQMRSRDASRCAYHEAMHAMGVRGHPAGQTVLSYFPWKTDGLMPLDKVLLRAWYSPRMVAGMTPFESLPVLADELLATMPNKAAAALVRDQFFAATIQQMHAYAAGQGDIPAVVKRSGKATSEGIRYGRGEMSYFLGIAYMEGVTAPRDSNQAVRWLQRAATMGNRGAQVKLGAFKQ